MVCVRTISLFFIFLSFIIGYIDASPKRFLSNLSFGHKKKLNNHIHKVHFKAKLDKQVVRAKLSMELTVNDVNKPIQLIQGPVSSEHWIKQKYVQLQVDSQKGSYSLSFQKKGTYQIESHFLCQFKSNQNNLWKKSQLIIPEAPERLVHVFQSDTQSEIKLPGIIRAKESVSQKGKSLEGILQPGKALTIEWKSGAKATEAALVLSSNANNIVTVQHGSFAVDSLYRFDIAQGKLRELSLQVPKGIQVTGVHGGYIQDWNVDDTKNILKVRLNQAQTKTYHLHILSEQAFGELPLSTTLLNIKPLHCIRSSGTLLIGGDHAIQASLRQTLGLIQINTNAFKYKMIVGRKRNIPNKKAYGFKHSAADYSLKLALKKIVPTYDVSHGQTLEILENNILYHDRIEINVKDAPLKKLSFLLPEGFSLSRISGPFIREDDVHIENLAQSKQKQVVVHFKQDVLGKTLIDLEIERGSNQLDQVISFTNIKIPGSRSTRGTLKLSIEKGLIFSVDKMNALREINVGSTTGSQLDIEKAFRFKNDPWSISLKTQKKKSGIHADTFHLMTINKHMIYGSVAASYFINDAPVNQLKFECPEYFNHIEFIGGDIRSWEQSGNTYTVHLNRKVIGDYNLAMVYHHRIKDREEVLINNVDCLGVETQSGYIALTSHEGVTVLNKQKDTGDVMRIGRDEIPEHYQLLIGSPIIDSFKHIGSPKPMPLNLKYFETSQVLPALIELADIHTEIVPSQEEKTELKTRLTYKIINTDKQFFNVILPEGATIWSTRLKVDDQHDFKKVLSTLDGKELKIPLPRNPNPNEPATLEIEYGQTHDKLNFMGELDLQAPNASLRSTFSRWSVSVPSEWTVQTSQSFDISQVSPNSANHFFQSLGSQLLNHCKTIIKKHQNILYGSLFLVFGLVVLTKLLKRPYWKPMLIISFLSFYIVIGMHAIQDDHIFLSSIPKDTIGQSLTFQETLQLQNDSRSELQLNIVPSWRSQLMSYETLSLGILSLIFIFLALIIKSFRTVLLAISFSSLICMSLSFSASWFFFLHLFTWFIPLLIMINILVRSFKTFKLYRQVRARLAMFLPLAFCFFFFQTELDASKPPKSLTKSNQNIDVENIQCQIQVEKDALLLNWTHHIKSHGPGKLQIPSHNMIHLPSNGNKNKNIQLVKEDKTYFIKVLRRGHYTFHSSFITALPDKENKLRGSLILAMPNAIKNKVKLTIPDINMKVTHQGTIYLNKIEEDGQTKIESVFKPGQSIRLSWAPRARERKQEEAKIFSQSLSLVQFNRGLVQSEHDIQLKIPQGTIRNIQLSIPKGNTVTGVEAKHLSSWQFDPNSSKLLIALSADALESYHLRIVCESPAVKIPYQYTFQPLKVIGSLTHKSSVGFISGQTVTLKTEHRGQMIDSDAFLRAAKHRFFRHGKTIALHSAYGLQKGNLGIRASIEAKLTEIRSKEAASFSISDERLIYNGRIDLGISKAGRFSFDLSFPKDYDIDSLHNPHMSHWEELETDHEKICRVYLNEWLLGSTFVNLTISKNIVELPNEILVPKVKVLTTLKHNGRLTISTDQGIRMGLSSRMGLSEIKHLQNNRNQQQSKSFRLLQKDWELKLKPEVIQARINAETLTVHTVHEGLVKSKNYIHFNLFNAGVKSFNLRMPSNALAVVIKGPKIAQIKKDDDVEGRWTIKLNEKWFGKPFPLQVQYETRFDHRRGDIHLEAFHVENIDMWKATTAMMIKGHLELEAVKGSEQMTPANARNIPAKFKAGDLSSAIFCYTSTAPNQDLTFKARKHATTRLLEAKVIKTDIKTLISKYYSQIHKVNLTLEIGNKRYLELILPKHSDLWSLHVAGKTVIPTIQRQEEKQSIMIPLPIVSAHEVETELQFTYSTAPQSQKEKSKLSLLGPKLDLPLHNINWMVYAPKHLRIGEVKGSLTAEFSRFENLPEHTFDANTYYRSLQQSKDVALDNAIKLQTLGQTLAKKGKQLEARRALESSFNYSIANKDFNEDARVQLHRLAEQQALVGLHGTRAELRARSNDGIASTQNIMGQDWGSNYTLQDAERLNNTLEKQDSRNLELIARRIVGLQTSTAMPPAQLDIHLPEQGQALTFHRPLLVDPFSELKIDIEVSSSTQSIPYQWMIVLLMAILITFILKINQFSLKASTKSTRA